MENTWTLKEATTSSQRFQHSVYYRFHSSPPQNPYFYLERMSKSKCQIANWTENVRPQNLLISTFDSNVLNCLNGYDFVRTRGVINAINFLKANGIKFGTIPFYLHIHTKLGSVWSKNRKRSCSFDFSKLWRLVKMPKRFEYGY